MIQFKTKEQPKARQRESLVADLGDGYDCLVETCSHSGWHAQILVVVPSIYDQSAIERALIQGFGDTADEAVRDAVVRYLAYHQNAVHAIERLKAKIQSSPTASCGMMLPQQAS